MRSSLAFGLLLLAAGCSTRTVYVANAPVTPTYYQAQPVYDAGLRRGASVQDTAYAGPTYGVSSYTPLLQRRAVALPDPPPVEVRLPYVEAVYLPDTIYAGEPFTVRFELSAPFAPDSLLMPTPSIPVSEVQYLDEAHYSGSIFLTPWRAAEPAEPTAAQPLKYYSSLDYTMCVRTDGRYHLQYWGADQRIDGGLPGALAYKSLFQQLTFPDQITLWALDFIVQPSRLPLDQLQGTASYGESYGRGYGYGNYGYGYSGNAPYCPGVAPYNEQVWAPSPSCPGTGSCFGAKNNLPHPSHQAWPIACPRPRPTPPAQTPQPTPTPQPPTVVAKQAQGPQPLQLHTTPANLPLPLQ